MSNAPDLSALTHELASRRARVDEQEAELAALRDPVAHSPVSRRHLLRGLAGLGAVGMAGMAAAEPAAAADGDPLLLGQANSAGSTTIVSTDNGIASTEVRIAESQYALVAVSPSTAIIGEIPAGGLAGVQGVASGVPGTGVLGLAQQAGGIGVVGYSKAGPALVGLSTDDGVTLELTPTARSGPPATTVPGVDEYRVGALSVDDTGELWLCVTTGAPGTWTRLLREDTAHGRVVPVNPFRALDTRAPGGRPAGAPAIPGQTQGPLSGGGTTTLDLAGAAGIPTTATAVVGNITAVTPTYTGYLKVQPAGATLLPSTLNFPARIHALANGFTCKLSPTGLSIYASPGSGGNTLHVVLDITAYVT